MAADFAAGHRGREAPIFEPIDHLPDGIVGVRARGRISREDHLDRLLPRLASARAAHARVGLLLELAPDFDGYSPGAVLADPRLGLGDLRPLERCALVSDLPWLSRAVPMFGVLLPFTVRGFRLAERPAALAWLAAAPLSTRLSCHLDTDLRVASVELRGYPGAAELDAVARVIDPWIESHEALRGLVLRVDGSLGWEHVSGILRHLRFVREHSRRIDRVAVVGDGALFDLEPRLAAGDLPAEVRHFTRRRLHDAVGWAAGSTAADA